MASTWNPDWLPLPGKAVFDYQHQQIAAVSRTPANLDLFVIGNESRLDQLLGRRQMEWRLVSPSRTGRV
jgi:hypothetical protein